MNLNWSKCCCLCGRVSPSYNNPDPVRDDKSDCCCSCNRLVINARSKCGELPEKERAAYIQRLRSMAYEELLAELGKGTNIQNLRNNTCKGKGCFE